MEDIEGILEAITKVRITLTPKDPPHDTTDTLIHSIETKFILNIGDKSNPIKRTRRRMIYPGIILQDSIGHKVLVKAEATGEVVYQVHDCILDRTYSSY